MSGSTIAPRPAFPNNITPLTAHYSAHIMLKSVAMVALLSQLLVARAIILFSFGGAHGDTC